MRDGILIAATVRLPPGKTLADGPFPTVIEYSGYETAAPHSLINAEEGKAPTNDPLLPDSSTVVGALVAPLLGFVAVSVQMRGTGCSGGAFDLLGYPSDYDGYDIVQTVGAQPWVLHHKVGMVGISYSGLSQFPVAGTDPPDLAAIAPLSPTDDLFSTGYPGGIYNDGFAKSWIAQRISDAKAGAGREARSGPRPRSPPATRPVWPTSGSIPRPRAWPRWSDPGWPGCRRCSTGGRRPCGPRKIKVPVFLVGSLQDEEVGPQWPALITALKGDRNVYVTMDNGTHTDSLGPDTISRWLEFLDIYVAGEVPTPSPTLSGRGPSALLRDSPGGPRRCPSPPSASPASRRWRRPRRPSPPAIPGSGCSSTTAAATSAPVPCSPPTRPASPPGPRPGRSTRFSLGPDGSLADRGAGPFLDGVVPAQPGRPAGRRPVVVGQRLGRPAALQLDAGPGRERDRLPDAGLHHGHDHRG